MRWNMILGALVLSVGLCGQSFGGGLLDRMLGCAASCGCEAPTCGCEAVPSCGCEAAPSWGCEPSCGCQPLCSPLKCGCGILDRCNSCCGCLLKFNKLCLPSGCGCDSGPSCGCETSCCEPACQPKCAKKCCLCCNHGGGILAGLQRLGARHGSGLCCDDGCADDAPEASDAAPMPPAPIVDPSAFVPSKVRRVLPISATR